MEFPRHMHKPGGLFVVVGNEAQYDECAAAGWADQASEHVEKPVEVRLEDAVKRADEAPADDAPKKKGKK